MFKEFCYLSTVGIISYLYNLYIYPLIICYLDLYFYNNLIISLLILVQVDNLILYKDIMDLKREINEDKYSKIILNQINYINNQINQINKLKRHSKSCNDLRKI